VWKRQVGKLTLNFHLAGINNQNFLMRDEETGTWWQQVTGIAVFGPLKGATLEPVASDELTFGLWKSESPGGEVLAPVKSDEKNYESDWEPKIAKLPVVISFQGNGLGDRDVVIGLEHNNSARAYPMATLVAQSPLQDYVDGLPILLAVGPDGKSVRVFISRIDDKQVEFFRKQDTPTWTLLDSATGSEWNFQGCAVSGPSQGKCLERITALKDFWFDWRNYHPATTVYHH
jgi:Protein of unknown function (DUF3179)